MLLKAVLISIFSRHQVLVLSCSQKHSISEYERTIIFGKSIFNNKPIRINQK